MLENCLFITNDCQLYGQVRSKDAESTIKSLTEEMPNLTWRIDTHRYVFCSNPTLNNYGIPMYNNPNELVSDSFVWITCVPEICECTITADDKVLLDPGLFNVITPEMIF